LNSIWGIWVQKRIYYAACVLGFSLNFLVKKSRRIWEHLVYYNTDFPAASRGDKAMGDCQGQEAQLSPLGEPGVHTPDEVKKLINIL